MITGFKGAGLEVFGSEKSFFNENFDGLKFEGGIIESVLFEECTFTDCDFSGVFFIDCEFIDSSFEKSNLSVSKFENSKFTDLVFLNSKLVGIDWTLADWSMQSSSSPLRFLNSILDDSSFFGLKLKGLTIKRSSVHNVDFRSGEFTKGIFIDSDFSGALFGSTNLMCADFRGAKNYRIDLNHNIITRAKFSRLEAFSLIESLDIDLFD